MRVGVLIIGSLYWDASRNRSRWRQDRLNCSHPSTVEVPIRYGKRAISRNNTYTMVFSRSAALGHALVVPVLAECETADHIIHEARCLWAAERNCEQLDGVTAKWGQVCVLKHPSIEAENKVLKGWIDHVPRRPALAVATGESPVVDQATGLATFEWPKNVATNRHLEDFDFLLMTANEPSLSVDGAYANAPEVARPWRDDVESNVMYFYNNRYFGITTSQDDEILRILRGNDAATGNPKMSSSTSTSL